MDFAQQLGRRMRRARIDRGITQAELALSAGVGANYIPRLERGEMVPSVEAAWRIARALGVSLDALCGRTSRRNGDDAGEALSRLQRADIVALRRVADAIESVGHVGKKK
jgi:transcriptional regulator with XRE-family HTH domain